MSVQYKAIFTCDQKGCEQKSDLTSVSVEMDLDEDSDSYGNTRCTAVPYPSEVPKGWKLEWLYSYPRILCPACAKGIK